MEADTVTIEMVVEEGGRVGMEEEKERREDKRDRDGF